MRMNGFKEIAQFQNNRQSAGLGSSSQNNTEYLAIKCQLRTKKFANTVRYLGLLCLVSLFSFVTVEDTQASEIRGHGNRNCLDVPFASRANGEDLWMWQCNGLSAQNWTYDRGTQQVKVFGNKCLDLENAWTRNGTPVQIWDCKTYWDRSTSRVKALPQQRWYVSVTGQIQSAIDPTKCLDVRGWGTANRTRVQIWDCVENPVISAQKWQVNPDDRMKQCNGQSYFKDITIDHATKEGKRGVIFRATPTEDAKRTAWRWWNHDNLWSQFQDCLGNNFGFKLIERQDLDTDYIYDQLICHVMAEQVPLLRGKIGHQWDLEVDNFSNIDLCNDVWPL